MTERVSADEHDDVVELALAEGLDGTSHGALLDAIAVVAAALEHFGLGQALGQLRTAVIAFEHAPLALALDERGQLRAAMAAPGSTMVPGALLARLRRRIADE